MHGKRMNDARQRKEHILQSAQKVFLKKGYYGATIDEIAAEEGVVRGTILHYFKSKEELMQNVLKNAGKEFVSEIEQLMSNEKRSVTERIEMVLKLCEEQFCRVKPQIEHYAEENTEFRFVMDQIRIKTFYNIADALEKLLDEGNKEGSLKIPNIRARAESVVFAVFGNTGSNLTAEEMMAELQNVIEKMIFE